MIQGRRVLAVVPARGGSKGIKLKNLRKVGGVSLVSRVGDVLRALPMIDRCVVSTDHEDIALAAQRSGIDAPFRRAGYLSGDRIGDLEVLTEAVTEMERIDGCRYHVIVMLQPTSPLRRAEDVARTLEKLVGEEWDSVWTVSRTDSKSHPLKQLIVGEDGNLDYYDAMGAGIIARQQLSTLYHRNGVAYAITRECLLEQKTVKGEKAAALVLEGFHVSIDTEFDIWLANTLLASKETLVVQSILSGR